MHIDMHDNNIMDSALMVSTNFQPGHSNGKRGSTIIIDFSVS